MPPEQNKQTNKKEKLSQLQKEEIDMNKTSFVKYLFKTFPVV